MPERKLQSVNPATEEVIEEFDFFDDQTLESKVLLAESTFKEFKHSSFSFRAECMKKVADLLEKRADDYGKTLTKEMGKTYKQAVSECKKCAKWCRYYAENAEKILSDKPVSMPASNKVGKKVSIVYSPMGTLLQIAPFNFPFLQVIRFASACLMAGNVCLVRHSHNCTLSAKHLEDMFKEAGFPEGCLQLILVTKDQVSKLIADDRIKGVTITGSAGAGKAIAKQCGENLKKHVMELGGSDAYIVCEDADLELAVKECAKGRIVNNGQSCTAAKRYIVVESIYQQFCDKVVQQFKNFKVGDPFKEDTDIGPLARGDLRDTVHHAVKKAEQGGAKILCGGEIPTGRGFYYPATVLSDVTAENPAFNEEIFGPVATIIKAKDENHAVELANKSIYGLGGGIFTKDASKGEKLVREMDAGLLFVNGVVTSSPEYPFGGVKQSGYGRECGEAGIKEWVTMKSVVIK